MSEAGPKSGRAAADVEAERDLILRLAAGDDAVIGPLYDRLSRPLYSLILHHLRDRSEAEDVLHDTFLALRDKAGTFDARKGSVLAWALTIARNRTLDRLRMRRRRGELLAQAEPEDLGYAGQGEPALQDQPWIEARAGVHAALAELPEDQRMALQLVYFQGLSHAEVAQQLDLPLGTVKARIRRGLLRLRSLLPANPFL